MLIALFVLILLVYWDLRSLVHHWQRECARYGDFLALQREADNLLDAIRALEHRVKNAEGNISSNFSTLNRHSENVRSDLQAQFGLLREYFEMEQGLMNQLLGDLGFRRVTVPRKAAVQVEEKARYELGAKS